jgi:hypothetical protein
MLICRVVDIKRVDAKCRASGGTKQVVADVRAQPARLAALTFFFRLLPPSVPRVRAFHSTLAHVFDIFSY